jgi:hypothetical protein
MGLVESLLRVGFGLIQGLFSWDRFEVYLGFVWDLFAVSLWSIFRFCLRTLFKVVCVFLQGWLDIYSRLVLRFTVRYFGVVFYI